ncbi:hypothetical protein O0S10_04920, partial [Methanocorpusculum sp. MG]|nr:hypothetical protein [Methanocorpusculum petauri]
CPPGWFQESFVVDFLGRNISETGKTTESDDPTENTYPLVTDAERSGAREVHGLSYDLNTGILSKIA